MSALPEGTVLRDYRVLRQIGEGGMNRVYLVEDTDGRQWALKETREAGEIQSSHEEILRQFDREILILSSLQHPLIPAIARNFSIGPRCYIVEEYIDGQPLDKIIASSLPGQAEVINLAISLCDVLDYLHRQRIIFRDLKPANIMMTKEGTLKLIDFDIARFHVEWKNQDTTTLGTPGFAAPETYGFSQSDARSDIYSLGATMHNLLTGLDPQDRAFQFEPIANLRRDIDPDLIRLVEKAINLKPEKRFQSAGSMKGALEKIRRRMPPSPSAFSNFLTVASFSPSTTKSFPRSLAAMFGYPSEELVEALEKKDWTVASLLIKSIIDKNASDELGRTLLHWAVFENSRDLVWSLIDHGASPDIEDSSCMTPLDWAIFSRKSDIAKLLIHLGADLERPDAAGRTRLYRAVKDDYEELAGLLIDSGANLNAQDNMGWTPLHLSVYRGRMAILKKLVSAGADISPKTCSGLTALHCAAEKGRKEALELLLKKGADAGATDSSMNTPLHFAASLGLWETASLLIIYGAYADAKNRAQTTPLHLAAAGHHGDISSLLIANGASINEKDFAGRTPFHHLVMGVEIGTSYAGPDGKMSGNLPGPDKLPKTGIRDMAEFLMAKGGDPFIADKSGKMPIHYAIERGCREIVELYVAMGVTGSCEDGKGTSFFTFAIQHGESDDIAAYLLETDASIDLQDPRYEFPMHAASEKGQLRLIEALIRRRADVNGIDREGKTPLHYASSPEVVDLLVHYGADINILSASGKSPMDCASEDERMAIFKSLWDRGARLTEYHQGTSSSLYSAIKKRNTERAKMFIERGADLTLSDNKGRTPLHFAVEMRMPDVVKVLLHKGVDVNCRDRQGMTPLHSAVQNDDRPIVLMLVDRRADIGAEDQQGRTPLSLAKSDEMIKVLESGQY
jgi:ankyrin repeat protein